MASTLEIARLIIRKCRRADYAALSPKNWDIRKIAYPFYFMFHPVEAGYEIKYKRKGSVLLANVIALLVFFVTLVNKASTGFIFYLSRPESLNSWLVLGQTVALLILWAVANWALCTLMDGEGWFREIWIFTCYAMLPAVLLTLPVVLLSNVLVLEEQAFLLIFRMVINGWCLILLLFSVMIAQQYTLKKTILSMLLTVVGVAAIIFLLVLLFSLFQQFYTFLNTVFKEVSFRL